jgi:DUF438 domain-containing protein
MTLYFQRGAIDADHLPFVLRMLPFDISFADEDDVLRYWSGRTYRTCDPHFIGQDLRACHPAASLETLEAILQAFRSGEHDIAEGWHENGGRFTYTSYTAVRDDSGAYRGILEVNHDLTDGRALAGEQALPGW